MSHFYPAPSSVNQRALHTGRGVLSFWDIESRSELSLKKAGAYMYARHPSTSILCHSWAIGEQRVHTWPDEDPRPFIEWIQRGGLIEAHNVFFERCMYWFILHLRHGWPWPHERQWRCSAAKAARHSIPRELGQAGRALRLTDVKDEAGKAIMLKVSRPRKPTKYDHWLWNENEKDLRDTRLYNAQDVVAERALSNALDDLDPYEQEVWFMDQRINMRGIRCDIPTVKGALKINDLLLQEANENLNYWTRGHVRTVGQRDKILEWLASRGLTMSDLTKESVKESLDMFGPQLPEDIKEVLLIRQRNGKASTKKYQKILEHADPIDWRVREILRYWGANTGRWAGLGIQIQNFPRKTLKGAELALAIELIRSADLDGLRMYWSNPMDVLSKCLRSMLCAAPGYRLMCADYSSVEARGVVWLANDDKGLRLFYEGKCPYIAMASVVFNVPVESVTDDQRLIGKIAVLGLGYGLGDLTFVIYAKKQWGVDVEPKLAEKIVKIYRETYETVVALWGRIGEAAMNATRYGGVHITDRVSYYRDNKNFLNCVLPSGRTIKYYDPQIRARKMPWGEVKPSLCYMSMNSKAQWVRTFSWGGKLVENIVQGFCRDILTPAQLALESHGYPIVLSLHDEPVAEVPNGHGTLDEYKKLMCRPLDWAHGLPIAVGDDAWEGERYRK